MSSFNSSPVERDNIYKPFSTKLLAEVIESDNVLYARINSKSLKNKTKFSIADTALSGIDTDKSGYITVRFTNSSYNLNHCRIKFRKEDGRWVRYHVSEFNAMLYSGKGFAPFAPNWMVEGYLVINSKNNVKFKYEDLYDHKVNYMRANGNDLDVNYDFRQG